MRPRSAALLVVAALAAGCGDHTASIPHLSRAPPTAMERSFVAGLPTPRPVRYVQLIRREAVAARAQPVDVRVFGKAPVVTLAVSDPAPFLKRRLQRFLDKTELPGHGDVYLRVVDGDGRRVLEWMHQETAGALWIRRTLLECSPIQPVGRLLGATYPPCPA